MGRVAAAACTTASRSVRTSCPCRFAAPPPHPPAAVAYFKEKGVTFLPAKAANAGGVAVSGLEMSQNRCRPSAEQRVCRRRARLRRACTPRRRMGLSWSREEVCEKLRGIMQEIYRASKEAAERWAAGAGGGGAPAGDQPRLTRLRAARLAPGAGTVLTWQRAPTSPHF